VSKLRLTMIDVGWGDSILLESEQSDGKCAYALIDSNDTTTSRSTYIFLKRFFEKKQQAVPSASLIFDWVLLTHAHADHGQGLQRILKDFGTSRFWYSRSLNRPAFVGALLRYAARSPRVGQDDALDSSALLPSFGAASLQVIWPHPGVLSQNENDNSIVLVITLGILREVLELLNGWQFMETRLAIERQADCPNPRGSEDCRKPDFDVLPVIERAALLELAAWLFDDWPSRLIDVAQRSIDLKPEWLSLELPLIHKLLDIQYLLPNTPNEQLALDFGGKQLSLPLEEQKDCA
jgi:hypothetical protein